MSKLFEAHISLEGKPTPVYSELVTEFGWHFSEFLGDPDEGEGKFLYLTRRFPTFKDAQAATEEVANVLKPFGVTRKKIELIVADTKNETW